MYVAKPEEGEEKDRSTRRRKRHGLLLFLPKDKAFFPELMLGDLFYIFSLFQHLGLVLSENYIQLNRFTFVGHHCHSTSCPFFGF